LWNLTHTNRGPIGELEYLLVRIYIFDMNMNIERDRPNKGFT
jgi:hypothetical protein